MGKIVSKRALLKKIKLFGLFENEIGPGVFQLTLQKRMYAARNQRHTESATENVSILSLLYGILTEYMFHYYIFIMSQLWLTFCLRSTVVLLDTGTPGTS